MELTADQKAAQEAMKAFFAGPDATFMLEGGAGVGKTLLTSLELEAFKRKPVVVVAAPTHKAVNVLRRKLDAAGLDWVRGYDDYSYDGQSIVTGTTAQLLGIVPVIDDDQDERTRTFGRGGEGMLSKVTPRIVVIDEVSMLGFQDLQGLRELAKSRKFKLLLVGDEGQLPPVKAKAIPFAAFKNRATLRQIVRQAEGSAIPKLAWALRDREDWQAVRGPGVRREKYVLDAFLEAVKAPEERLEEEREVFIAYRNVVVNAAQEKACQLLYGHGREAFQAGELVLAACSLYRKSLSGPPVLLCANQDELIVEAFEPEDRHPIYGTPVRMRAARERGSFRAWYLSPEDRANDQHPYNLELKRLALEANALQTRVKALPNGDQKWALDKERKKAWAAFFEMKDQTVITFAHPFAITSHKSQGSTYRSVYVDVSDVERFSRHALYVAVTRPREDLVLGGGK